jgi:benzoyl-CoA 2,3-dioxygenase component A
MNAPENTPEAVVVIRQHLIDPEVCIRCNTCEETCPVDAITHDSRNYVVNADICNACNACISPCPTGSIDHWRTVVKAQAYSIEDQLGWDELPPEKPLPALAEASAAAPAPAHATAGADAEAPQSNAATSPSSTTAPWSAAHPYLHLYGLKKPVTATVAGNFRLTSPTVDNDVRHIVLDLGTQFFPLLEGQSVGVLPPGVDANGRPHYLRMYSVASPRTGEREGYNNLSLTVKRVTQDHDGKPTTGVASNFLCDLQRGDTVQLTGPFGTSFLMPNHPGSNILMVCTGTGSAPMRAMTEHRRRLKEAEKAGKADGGRPTGGKLMLFFGARTPEELPYFGPLTKLPPELMDTTLAFSRVPGQPRAYVQDRIRERARDVADLLRGDTFVYLCGLKGMETGVLEALQEACSLTGLHWPALHQRLVEEGRFHVETY